MRPIRPHLSEQGNAAATMSAAVASPTLPDDASAPPRPAALFARLSGLGTTLRGFLRTHGYWAAFLVPYLAAWWQPILWNTNEDHWWGQHDSPLIWQPLVPIGVLLLVWQDRERIAQHLAQLRARFGEQGKKLRGSVALLLLGCLTLMAAQLVHVAAVAIAGLILIVAGVVVRLYGRYMLLTLVRPFLFWLLMLPPPATAVSALIPKSRSVAAQMAASILSLFGKGSMAQEDTIHFANHTVTLTTHSGGASAVLITAALLLFVAVWRRYRIGGIIALLCIGGGFALLLNLLRVLAVAVTSFQGNDPKFYWMFAGFLLVTGIPLSLFLLWRAAKAPQEERGERHLNAALILLVALIPSLTALGSGRNAASVDNFQNLTPWVLSLAAFGLTLDMEKRLRPWVLWLEARWQKAAQISATANRATDRIAGQLTETTATRMGFIGRAWKASHDAIEQMFRALDRFIAARFKKKNRWDQGDRWRQ